MNFIFSFELFSENAFLRFVNEGIGSELPGHLLGLAIAVWVDGASLDQDLLFLLYAGAFGQLEVRLSLFREVRRVEARASRGVILDHAEDFECFGDQF